MVRSGEITGQLAEVLGELVRSLKRQAELAAQTKKLLMYPAFVTVTISGVVVFLMVYLVPQLVSFIRNMGQEEDAACGSGSGCPRPCGLLVAHPAHAGGAGGGVALAARANEQLRFKLHQAVLAIPAVGPVIKKSSWRA